MHFKNPRICLFTAFAFWAIFSSCVNTQKVTYFNDVKDSARICQRQPGTGYSKKRYFKYYGE